MTANAYCPTCKQVRRYEAAEQVSRSGRKMLTGPCEVCGTQLNRVAA